MIITGGKVCDGTGSLPVFRDILIKGDRIAAIGQPGEFAKSEEAVISAAGKLVAPGFIDVHGHNEKSLLRYPEAKTLLRQGVTAIINGNCGLAPACAAGEADEYKWQNLQEYRQIVRQCRPAVNTAVLCGHNTLRQQVVGLEPRLASPEEIRKMQRLLAECCEMGAIGFSSGLPYFPGKFADTAELKALNTVLKHSGKIYASHIRSEGDQLLEALQEAGEIARAGSGRLQLSHLKTMFPKNFHKIDDLLNTVNSWRAGGMEVYADRYPSIYSATRLGQVLPPPYDKIPDVWEKLKNSPEFKQEVIAALTHSPRDLASTIVFSRGKSIAELANGRSLEETCMEFLLEDPEQTAAYKAMSEENMRRIIAENWVCAGTDAGEMPLDKQGVKTHPRTINTFPKFFRMVADTQGVAEAVRRITSLPAEIFQLAERGIIKKGFFADLVIFDEAGFDCAASFADPAIAPAGIAKVLVNGQIAFDAAQPEKIGRFGRFL